jgi:hypothetical protein
MKIIFLDMDGVLNTLRHYDWTDGPLALVDPSMMKRLNRIVQETKAKVVLSSAWRYMVHSGSMRVRGFSQLLWSHGFVGEVIDVTCRDDEAGMVERGDQIAAWVRENKPEAYVVLDDCTDPAMAQHPFIHTDGNVGLTEADADKAIAYLNGTNDNP